MKPPQLTIISNIKPMPMNAVEAEQYSQAIRPLIERALEKMKVRRV